MPFRSYLLTPEGSVEKGIAEIAIQNGEGVSCVRFRPTTIAPERLLGCASKADPRRIEIGAVSDSRQFLQYD